MNKIKFFLIFTSITYLTGCSGCNSVEFKNFFLGLLCASLFFLIIFLIFSISKIENHAKDQLIAYFERITLLAAERLSEVINKSSVSVNRSTKEIDFLRTKISNYHDEGLKYMEKMLFEIHEKHNELRSLYIDLQKDNQSLTSQMSKFIIDKDEFNEKVSALEKKTNECEILKSELKQTMHELENEKKNNSMYLEKLDKYNIWHSNEHEVLDLKNKWKKLISTGETKKVLTEIINCPNLSPEIKDKARILSGQWSALEDTIKMGKPINDAHFNRIFEATTDIVNDI